MIPRQKGFGLLLAIVVVGIIGLTLALIARHFVGKTKISNAVAMDVRVAQLVASGQEWVAANTDRCATMETGSEIRLDLIDMFPPGADASLLIQRPSDVAEVIISARISYGPQAAVMHVVQSLRVEAQ